LARKNRNILNSPRQNQSKINKNLKKAGLLKFPTTDFDSSTAGQGILGVGLLNPRAEALSDFSSSEVNKKGRPVYLPSTVSKYKYFFVKKENPSIRGDEDFQYFFFVVECLEQISLADCSKQLGVKTKNITPITKNQLDTGSFSHPYYINQSYQKISIRYGEVPLLKQTTPGRMDNIPIGFPAFNYNPSPITTQVGMVPSAPFPSFYVSGFSIGATLVNVPAGGTVQFLNNTPTNPPQIRASAYSWSFGSGASPTGSTSSNPVVDYSGASGYITVSLTATNSKGSATKTKTNYIFKS